MNKRGSFKIAFEEMMIFPRLLLLVIISIGVVLLVNNYVDRDLETGEITSFVFAESLLSRDCFGEDNEFGVIDKGRLTEGILNGCLNYDQDFIAAKVNVYGKELIYHPAGEDVGFEGLKGLCDYRFNNYNCYTHSLYVLVNENGVLKPETMYVEVVVNE